MKLKTLVITVLVLAALSAVVAYLNRPAPIRSDDPRVNQPLVSTTDAEHATALKITDQGRSVTLAKAADGSWKVTSYHDFPADFNKLSGFVNELTSAKIEQLVTSNPERLGRLEFKDTQIQLLGASDKPLVAITQGKNADAGGRFVRFGEEQKAYRASLGSWIDADSKNWADTTLVTIKPDDVARAEVSFPDASVVVVKRAKKEDVFSAENPPTGKELNADKFASLLSTFTSLRFSETTESSDPEAEAAKQNQRSAKLTTFDGKTWTISLGRRPEQKILKPPAPKPDGKTGPAALGTVAETEKSQTPTDGAIDGGPAKVSEPETETIPAGPVFAFVSSSDAQAPINALMNKRSFQVNEYAFIGLLQQPDELFEPIPQTPPPAAESKTETAAPVPEMKK